MTSRSSRYELVNSSPVNSVLIFLLIFFCQRTSAQHDSASVAADGPWSFDGTYMLNINESTFSSWAAGGENQLGIATILKPGFIYDDKSWSWITELDFRFGSQRTQSGSNKKNDDVFKVETKAGKRFSKNWKFSGLYTLSTQFAPSRSEGRINSAFMAPAYTNLSLGFDYNPKTELSVYMTPLNLRSTYLLNDSLSAQGAFGVTPGEKYLLRLGPSFLISYKDDLFQNFLVDTKLGVFMNFVDGLGNPIVNWDAIITMKINKYMATTFAANLFFDPESKVNIYDDTGNVTGKEAKIQFKQVLGFGFNVKW